MKATDPSRFRITAYLPRSTSIRIFSFPSVVKAAPTLAINVGLEADMTAKGETRSRIFVSYRREDTGGHVLALIPRLRERFGAKSVFKDTDSVAPGDDFVAAIQKELETCSVFLAMIGKEWLAIRDPRHGRRRLDDPDDFLRLEIGTALQNDKIVVIPVLVGRATIPPVEDLPDDLVRLARRNAIELTDTRWESDVEHLIRAIEGALAVAAANARVADNRRTQPEDERKDLLRKPRSSLSRGKLSRTLIATVIVGGLVAVVGYVFRPKPPFGTRITMTALEGLRGAHRDVNDHGQIVGEVQGDAPRDSRIYLWTPREPRDTAGSLQFVDVGFAAAGFAAAITNAGFMLGRTMEPDGKLRNDAIWSSAYRWQALSTLPGEFAQPTAISETGSVVGAVDSGEKSRPAIWEASVTEDGKVTNSPPSYLAEFGSAIVVFSIDRKGRYAVGWYGAGEPHPLLWIRQDEGWMRRDLTLLPGDRDAMAVAVNSHGQAVGTSHSQNSDCRQGATWDPTGQIRALPAQSNPCRVVVTDINDEGVVVGTVQDSPVMWIVSPSSIAGPIHLPVPAGASGGSASKVSSTLRGLAQIVGWAVFKDAPGTGTTGRERSVPIMWSVR